MRATVDQSTAASVFRAFNRLPTAELRMQVARALAQVIDSGAEVDPDSGLAVPLGADD